MRNFSYRPAALQELIDFAKERKDYPLSHILYSFLRESFTGIKEVKDIKKLSDEELYELIEKAKEYENE